MVPVEMVSLRVDVEVLFIENIEHNTLWIVARHHVFTRR